ncbi:MarR family transcriptional regulator [Pseudodesulfovibrio sp. zrk46]|uniref:MarR family winged helix-turn-helix transcriptional regulator n=1 Tax=Pseudodesulfovibrio sp. zrk46 TaxID=2725288 RepID=UPI001448FFB5|nr:MarR family transcriptional regulator [Pseudodesulfovibrio sp. zrk46]QJB55091.1 MarR family transcriptional regulator [Pseudodesulfovibrio sp. zrk46]
MIFKETKKKSPSYRAARIFRTNACLLDKKLAALGLCHGQLPYLLGVATQAGQTQDELATSIRVHRAATARTLKGMEDAGLITRKENPENRRQKLVYPTDKANALIDDVLAILDEQNELMLKGFTTEEKIQLLTLMDRVLDNLDNAIKEGCNV